jgi:hypothetical protein
MVNYWNPTNFHPFFIVRLLWVRVHSGGPEWGKNQGLTQMDARKLKKAMQRQQPKREEIKLGISQGTAALLLKKQQHLDCIMYVICSSSSSVHDNA